MATGKQHSHVINNCLKFWENLPSIYLTTAKALIAKKKKKKKKKNSKYWCPGTVNVDAFTVSWSAEYNYLVTSILIPRVISHIKNSKSTGGLLIPLWPLQFLFGH